MTEGDQPFEGAPEAELQFPHGEYALKLFEKRHKDNSHKEALVNVARYLEEEFFHDTLHNIDVFESNGATMPYTVVNATEIARRIHEQLPEVTPEQRAQAGKLPATGREPQHKQYIIEPSFYQTFSGGPFTFTEFALDEYYKSVFGALQALRRGDEPDTVEIYTLGAPTNYLGHVSPEWAERFQKGNAFEMLGELYAEFIAEHLPQDEEERKRTHLVLQGHSASSSYALETGRQLLERHLVTQNRGMDKQPDEIDLPQLQLLLDNTAGMNETYGAKGMAMKAGFAADVAIMTLTRFGLVRVAAGEKGFMEKVVEHPAVKAKGLKTYTDPEQTEMKKEIIETLKERITRGEPFAENVKANVRYSTNDMTIHNRDKNRAIEQAKAEAAERTGHEQNAIVMRNESNPNLREFPNTGFHNPDWFRDSVMDQWGRAAAFILREQGVADAHIDKLG